MKKIGLLVCLLVGITVLTTGCQSLGKTAETVKKDAESYLKKVSDTVGALEKETQIKFEELKNELKHDVIESEKFAEKAKEELVIKLEELAKEAKKLEVEGEGYLDNVHTHFTELLEKQVEAMRKLITAIESGAQTAYEEAKIEVEKIASEIVGHKNTVGNLAK